MTISGFKEFTDKCNNLSESLQDDFNEVAGFAASTWELRAKQDAPKDVGFLAGGISHKQVKKGEWDVVSSKLYSPFMEWGTKKKVRVPADLVAYAAKFKGITAPGGAKAIYEWCRRVGIPQNAWVFIYLEIMRNGVNPHPFFFIQRPIVEQQLVNDLKQVLEEER